LPTIARTLFPEEALEDALQVDLCNTFTRIGNLHNDFMSVSLCV